MRRVKFKHWIGVKQVNHRKILWGLSTTWDVIDDYIEGEGYLHKLKSVSGTASSEDGLYVTGYERAVVEDASTGKIYTMQLNEIVFMDKPSTDKQDKA